MLGKKHYCERGLMIFVGMIYAALRQADIFKRERR